MYNGKDDLITNKNTNSPYQDKPRKWSSHWRIASMLASFPEGTRILDIGAATGVVARMCSEHGLLMRGIEPDESRAQEASKYYSDMFIGDLEHTPDIYLEGHDVVLCADVLEHMLHPEKELKRLVSLQQKNCIYIISVPNIANLWIRINLLFGKFDYTERGILDQTHLHFYTRKTFHNLINGAGLEISRMHVTPIPLELVSPFFIRTILGRNLYTLLYFMTKGWPTMFSYQWIAMAHETRESL